MTYTLIDPVEVLYEFLCKKHHPEIQKKYPHIVKWAELHEPHDDADEAWSNDELTLPVPYMLELINDYYSTFAFGFGLECQERESSEESGCIWCGYDADGKCNKKDGFTSSCQRHYPECKCRGMGDD